MRRTGDDLQQAYDGFAGTLSDVLVRGLSVERAQALEIDREIGCGVELGHLPGFEMVEPGPHPRRSHRRLLAAKPARPHETFVGEQPTGKIGGSVEEQRVV